ncbi:hypothetical protein C2E20_5393 [Micractinium conductrix]|uniref:Cyanocobalamin reductase (cyanide-eliminating) n=1 Tax=Micractinium conductrix TaxID=554055 RepID=A0A2P6VB20_9CHLO|nr:hypothetical protein C2E20_5393 [Micractinium conductrix]|eukprot:PSC71268.1 hypothetical protein C2E20_5393 [Micractinium conductrix]
MPSGACRWAIPAFSSTLTAAHDCSWSEPHPLYPGDELQRLTCSEKSGCNADGHCAVCPVHTGRVGTKCLSCADKLCASCPRDPAVCRRCLPGYRLVQGECVKCKGTVSPFKFSCAKCSRRRTCKACRPGYGRDADDECRRCTATRAPDDALPTGIPCTDCFADFEKCKACRSPLDASTGQRMNVYAPSSGQCSLCPVGCHTAPGACDGTTGVCTACSRGFGFNATRKTCVPCKGNPPLPQPPTCLDCDILSACLSDSLACSGIDVSTPLALKWYNDSIPAELGARIPARGAAGQAALCVLVGNTRSLWEPFLEACASEGLLAGDNPLEAYLDGRVGAALAACVPNLRRRIYWSHRRTDELEGGPEGKSEHVAMQRMAHHAGLAYLDESSHLCMHPRFGPWFSLRCVIIFDDIAYDAPKPEEPRNPLPLATQQYVRMALHSAVHNTSRKYHVPEVDVEAAEAVLAETSMEPVLEEGSDSEAEQAGKHHRRGSARLPGSSTRSTVGSEAPLPSGGSTPACSSAASSGCSSPRSGVDAAAAPLAPAPAGPEGVAATAAARPTAASLTAAGPGRPCAPGAAAAGHAHSSSAGGFGSPGSSASRRSSLEREGRPSMRAVAANWRAWLAVRDAPCPGHPWRYSEEQITYHYTRDRSILLKALLRRNLGLGPGTPPQLNASGLLDPALVSYHGATMLAHKKCAAAEAAAVAAVAAAAAEREPSEASAVTAAS